MIHAPAARVYDIIADYRVHHPRIVPPEYLRLDQYASSLTS